MLILCYEFWYGNALSTHPNGKTQILLNIPPPPLVFFGVKHNGVHLLLYALRISAPECYFQFFQWWKLLLSYDLKRNK
jgi:hypothetical protein